MATGIFSNRYSAEDHSSCLILLSTVGGQSLSADDYESLSTRIQAVTYVPVSGSGSQQRHLQLQYRIQNYSLEENAWGDFQSHRKCLGLLSIAYCTNTVELSEASLQYDAIRQRYENTLYDSRLIVIGIGKDGDNDSSVLEQDKQNSNVPEPKSPSAQHPLNANSLLKNVKNSTALHSITNNDNRLGSSRGPLSGGPSAGGPALGVAQAHIWYYASLSDATDLEQRLHEFASSIFWILESKRMDRAFERQDKPLLLMAPFESKDFVGVDTDTRTYRKRCFGRLKKHTGDLCLQAGLPAEALLHYQTSAETLRGIHDWLWLAGAYEGMCSASVVTNLNQSELTTAEAEKPGSFSRNLSFSVKRGIKNGQERNNFINRSFSKGLANLDLAASLTKKNLIPDDVIEKYREALSHYSKFRHASLVEIQASMKAANILIGQQRHLEAAQFLQNIVYINQPMSDVEKIQRYSVLADLYEGMGFLRKAGFYRRIAGMQCVAPTNPAPDWQRCYQLLTHALPAYKLSLDYREVKHNQGWPVAQLRLLHELIYSARRLGKSQVVVRHIQLLLHSMFEYLLDSELTDLCTVLEEYGKKVDSPEESLPNVSPIEGGIPMLMAGTFPPNVPPVPFIKIPAVKTLTALPLSPHLTPIAIKSAKTLSSDSPFIFSPMQNVKKQPKNMSKLDFQWVEGGVCEVSLLLTNPLPFELRVTNMGLLTEGVALHCYPTSICLPPHSCVSPVHIMGTPQHSGTLKITGYTHTTMGIVSECALSTVPLSSQGGTDCTPPSYYEIEILGALPQMSVSTTLPKSTTFTSNNNNNTNVICSAVATLYAGQSSVCEVTLTNIGKEKITMLEMSLESKMNPELLSLVYSYKNDVLSSNLPLCINDSVILSVNIDTPADFLPNDKSELPLHHSLPACISDFQRCEALLQFSYSGGNGYCDNYKRQISIALTTEILPNVVCKGWDVMYKSSTLCSLVFDFENVSSHEIIITTDCGTQNTHTIPINQTTRFTVDIERLDLNCWHRILTNNSAERLEVKSVNNYEYMNKLAALKQEFSAEIAQRVKLKWSMSSDQSSEDISGVVLLDSLSWTREQAATICTNPVKCDLSIHGNLCLDLRHSVQTGEVVDIVLNVQNTTDFTLSNLDATVCCYHDNQDGCHANAFVTNSAVCVGLQHFTFTTLQSKSSVSLNIRLMFLQPGRYCVKTKQNSYQFNTNELESFVNLMHYPLIIDVSGE